MGTVRFTIDVNGQPRTLFSVVERRNDVTLVLKSAHFNARHGSAVFLEYFPSNTSSKIIENRYSIHPSPSSDSINVIKHTMVLANGDRIHNRNYTQVIKKKERFTLVYCRQCGNIALPRYAAQGKFTNVSLGSFEPQYFTLMYGVFVGASDAEFAGQYEARILNVLQHKFDKIRIVVFWTFMNIASPPQWLTLFFSTIPPEKLEPGIHDYGLGLAPDECGPYFGNHINTMKDHLLRPWLQIIPQTPWLFSEALPIFSKKASMIPALDLRSSPIEKLK